MLIYGRNVVYEAFKASRKIFEIFVDEKTMKSNEKLITSFKENNIKVTIKSKNQLDTLCGGNSQGFVANVDEYNYKELSDVLDINKKQFFLILDGIEDPHNLGAMIRTAEATKIDGIIIPKNRSVSLNKTVVKVSCGAVEYTNLIQVNNLNRCIEELKKSKFWVVGTALNEEKTHFDIDFDTSTAIVIGNEGKGISKLVKKNCDFNVSIPMIGNVNSLNASVSASLLMYEYLRKK